MATPREISTHVRRLVAEISATLEGLTYDPKSVTRGRTSTGTVLRTKSGSLIGQVADATAVEMIIEGPRWLKILVGYVDRMEREAYETRQERRRFREVAKFLYEAEQAGVGTPAGRRQVELALARLRAPDDREG